MTILAIDVGNTRLKWALFSSAQPGLLPSSESAVFLERIDDLADASRWHVIAPPKAVIGSNVAGDAVRRRVEEQLELWDTPVRWIVPSAADAGVTNGYDHPTRLGADRWAALVGARAHVVKRAAASGEPPKPALVVMVGTAVTVDALDASGKFLGGLIMPGFGLMLRALEQGTAGLKVPTGEVVDFPTNTSDALMSGGSHALGGAIERMYARLATRAGVAPLLLMTGGAAVKMAPIVSTLPVEVIDGLIFDGLLALHASRQPAAAT
jgi:type III pantothenate kinase